jgi:hypothetical protein
MDAGRYKDYVSVMPFINVDRFDVAVGEESSLCRSPPRDSRPIRLGKSPDDRLLSYDAEGVLSLP